MAGKQVRMVNVVPMLGKVKVERLSSDEDEDTVACRVCSKSFASNIALRNHARMEHIEVFSQGDPNLWTAVPDEPPSKKQKVEEFCKVKTEEDVDRIKLRTQQILSSMSAGNLMSLVSNDVSYIIIKSEEDAEEAPRKRRPRQVLRTGPRDPPKKKEPQPITGPFECVQPSNLVADGVCHQIFFSCCEYSVHYRDEHTRRRKGLRCQVCEKPLAAGDEGKAPYTCEVCGAGFNASKELSEHTSAAHVKLKPFQCEVCHKRFTQQGGVAQHMRMHTGVRPFPCTFCSKAFTQKSGLDQHLRIHTKVKPYRCVVCAKSFCQSVHLKQHMRTHTNVSPFQCAVCQKRFKQSSHLNYHLRNHAPVALADEFRAQYQQLVGYAEQHQQVEEVEEVAEVGEVGEMAEMGEVEDEGEVDDDQLEQVAAEQSIQVVGDEYVLAGSPGWTVQLAE